jgi:hypothetical protein
MIADAVMSLDNVIAVAAAAKGSIVLLTIGLLISVPLVVYGATLLISLINRWPVIIPGGAALIGYIGGEVVITDPAIEPWVNAHAHWFHDAIPLLGALLVVIVGRVIAPPPAAPAPAAIAGEALGAAAIAGARMAYQIIGRIVVARAPLIVTFIASLFGYSFAEAPGDAHATDAALAALHSIRPVFAAVIAVAFGELVAWAARRCRRPAPVGATD